MSFLLDNEENRAALSQRGGVYAGTVSDRSDPEQQGRLRLRIPSILHAEVHPTWALPLGVAYGAGTGGLVIPELGAQVYVMFLDGDVNVPLWLPGSFPRNRTPDDLAYRYPTTRVHWADRQGTKLVEREQGELTLTLRNRKLFVNTQEGDFEIDTLPRGKLQLNRGTDEQSAVRVGDRVQCGSLEFAFSPGPPATLSITYTDEFGTITSLAAGNGTLAVAGKPVDGSPSVKIG